MDSSSNVKEQLAAMTPSGSSENKNALSWHSPYNITLSVLALVLGLLIGWLDLQVTEVLITILALSAGGLLLGLLRPYAAWRWALFIAVGLPVMQVVAKTAGLKTAEPVQIDVLTMLVAFVFALAGAYAGVLIRRSVRFSASG